MAENKLLEVVALKKSFLDGAHRRREVLKEVAFHIDRGESVAILGASGSRKSTILISSD